MEPSKELNENIFLIYGELVSVNDPTEYELTRDILLVVQEVEEAIESNELENVIEDITYIYGVTTVKATILRMLKSPKLNQYHRNSLISIFEILFKMYAEQCPELWI